MMSVLSIFFVFPLLFLSNWFLGKRGLTLAMSDAVLVWTLAMAITHSLFSPVSYTGILVAVAESFGYTVAFSLVYWPLPKLEVLLIFIIFGVVSYCFGLLRIKRLKKKGYVEKIA